MEEGGETAEREGNAETFVEGRRTTGSGRTLFPPLPYHWECFLKRKTNGVDGAEGGEEEEKERRCREEPTETRTQCEPVSPATTFSSSSTQQ